MSADFDTRLRCLRIIPMGGKVERVKGKERPRNSPLLYCFAVAHCQLQYRRSEADWALILSTRRCLLMEEQPPTGCFNSYLPRFGNKLICTDVGPILISSSGTECDPAEKTVVLRKRRRRYADCKVAVDRDMP